MAILATRTIQYRSDHGSQRDVVLTVYEPFARDADDWRCGFQFHPPNNQRVINVGGMDSIEALLGCLRVARGYVEHPSEERTSWQGMPHSGLPWHRKMPEGYEAPELPPIEANPGGMALLAKRRLGIPDDHGGVRELILTLYRPFCVNDNMWKCAFSLASTESDSIRYGVGADFIEALLDALSMARVAYMGMVPPNWDAPESEGFQSARFLPYKVGRAYAIDSGEPVDSSQSPEKQ